MRIREIDALVGNDVLLMAKGKGAKLWKHRGLYRVERVTAYDVVLLKYGSGYKESIPLFELRKQTHCLVRNGIRVTVPMNTDYKRLMKELITEKNA